MAVLLQQWPIVMIANLLNAIVVATVLTAANGLSWVPVLWAAAVIGLTIGRWLVARSWRRDLAVEDPRRTLRLSAIGSGVSGLLWGGGLAFQFPADPVLQVLVAFVLGGMAAGAALSLSSHLPTMYAFLLPSILPVAGRLLLDGTPVYAAMGGLLVVFCVALVMIGHNLNIALILSLALQREKDDLVAQLKQVLADLEQRVAERTVSLREANDRLTVEIAERQRAERAERIARRDAEQANDAKSRFLAGASHDLRQPLQAMRLYYELLRNRLGPEPEARNAVSRLGDAMDATERLLAALMDISTLDAGSVTVNLETFSVQEVLDQLAREIEPQAIAAGISFRVSPSRYRVTSDPVLMARIIRNLLTNAIRHAGKGGVLLGCRRRGNMLRIEIWDRGPGVPPAQVEAIFEDFVRLGDDPSSGAHGLGLGLGVVKRMARLLGHPIGLRSWPGKGAVFYLDVPRSEASS